MTPEQSKLEHLLGFDGDPTKLEFVIPNEDSLIAALRQWQLAVSADFSEEELHQLEATIRKLDMLNNKYLKRIYTVKRAQVAQVRGLLLTYRRALQAVAAGILGELFLQFPNRPIVFRVLFGDQLGYDLYEFAEEEAHQLVRIEELRQQEHKAPGHFKQYIAQEIRDMSKNQRQLAVSLGMTKDTALRISRDLYLSRVNGTPIRPHEIGEEIFVKGGEVITWRIEQGRKKVSSGLYLNPKQIMDITEKEDARQFARQEVQIAKDLDRARVGRAIFEQSHYNLTTHARENPNRLGAKQKVE